MSALQEMLAGLTIRSEARLEFQLLLRKATPGLVFLYFKHDSEAEAGLESVLAELEQRGADLPVGLAFWVWSGRTFREYPYGLPALPYGAVIETAFHNLRTNPLAAIVDTE